MHRAIIAGSRRWLPKLGDGGRAGTRTTAASQTQCYKVQHNENPNPAPRGDEQHSLEHTDQVLLFAQRIHT